MSIKCWFAAVTTDSSDTALLSAALDGDAQKVEELLESGANPNVSFEGWTPLHYAVRQGHDEVAEILLNAGADPTRKTTDVKHTPLDVARTMGHGTLMFLLHAAENRFAPKPA